MNEAELIKKVLSNREQRFSIKQALAKQQYAIISLNLNVPDYPKSNKAIRKAFDAALIDLEDFLCAQRIKTIAKAKTVVYAESGDFCIIPIEQNQANLKAIKNHLEIFEASHQLGRLLDVDLSDNQLNPISSGKEKLCFICDKSAKVCARNRQHSAAELKKYVEDKIEQFNYVKRQRQITNKVAEFALKATLFESALYNKPGLVCPNSSGAHSDMDYFTFLSSSAAIAPYFEEMTALGFSLEKVGNINPIKTQLRVLGLQAERAMLQATNGVNTQKGIIFLMGLACFAAGHVFHALNDFSVESFRKTIKLLAKDSIKIDFDKNNTPQTHGEQCYRKYGKKLAGGARLEAENGFPTVFDVALPYLEQRIENYWQLTQNDWQKILELLLYKIIAVNNDVNILHRAGKAQLRDFQQMAKNLTTNDELETKAEKKMINFSLSKNISPGGSADLLALSLFIYFCKQTTIE